MRHLTLKAQPVELPHEPITFPYQLEIGIGGTLRCDCGGYLTFTIEPIYGRTVERCLGTCKYEGAPRPATDLPNAQTNQIGSVTRPEGTELCPRCNVRNTYSPYADRCRPCATEVHREQRNRAAMRYHARQSEAVRTKLSHEMAS